MMLIIYYNLMLILYKFNYFLVKIHQKIIITVGQNKLSTNL